MYLKPKRGKPKRGMPQPKQTPTGQVVPEKLSRDYDPALLSLDYLLENQVITILSQDDVIEHGKDYGFDEVEEVTRGGRDYMCYTDEMGYPDDLRDYSGLFSGVLYETWGLGLVYYRHYKNGLPDGADVNFYDSGKVRNYCVWNYYGPLGYFYEWYEDGKIKSVAYYYPGGKYYGYTDYDENGNVIRHIAKKVR